MNILHVIDCGKGQYLSAISIKVTGKSGGKASATLSDGLSDLRNPPICYAQVALADQLLALCQNGAKETSRGWSVVRVFFNATEQTLSRMP